MQNTLQIVINTLNQIEVKGKANMDRLLGAIITLESLMQRNSQTEQTAKEDKPHDD